MKKKRLFVAILLLVILTALGGWFWSLGGDDESTGDEKNIVVIVERSPVEVRNAGGEWHDVVGEQALAETDEVRTGNMGRATISFFDDAETTLREASHIRIAEAIPTGSDDGSLTATIQLLSGRVWSRVLQLVDLDSAFSVETNDVVATVRGTSFDISYEDGETDVWVADSRVELLSADSEEGVVIVEGWKTAVSGSDITSEEKKMEASDFTSDWFTRNANADKDFRGKKHDEASAFLKQAPQAGSSFLEKLKSLSHRMRLSLRKNRDPKAYTAFIGRRLYAMKELVDEGRTGLAMQEFSAFEKELLAKLNEPDGESYRAPAIRVLIAVERVLHDVEPRDPLFRLKQRVEDLLAQVVPGEVTKVLVHGRAVEARIHETIALLNDRAFPEAASNLDTAERGVVNAQRDAEALKGDAAKLKKLRAYLRALHRHIELLRTDVDEGMARGPALDELDLSSASSTSSVGESSTGSTSTQTTTSTGEVSSITRITVAAVKNPLFAGESTSLVITGHHADGSTENVTSNATLQLFGNLGNLVGNIYTAASPGSVTVEAQLPSGDTVLTAQTTISVNSSVVLQSLELVASQGPALPVGGSAGLTAIAHYSDQTTQVVTTRVNWKSSDPSVASVDGAVLYAVLPGVTTLTATYTELGQVASDAITFTVTASAQ